MSEIKIPVKWLSKKGIPLIADDTRLETQKESDGSKVTFITSFTDRKNKEKQPVADWVPVEVSITNYIRIGRGIACKWSWLDNTWHKITSWRPDIELLYKKYVTDRDEEVLNFMNDTTKLNQAETTQIKAGAEVYPGIITATENKERSVDFNVLFNLAMNNKYAQQIITEEEVDRVISDGVSDDASEIQKAYDGPEIKTSVTAKFEKTNYGFNCTEGGFISTPTFTKEMHDNGELPPVGCECEVIGNDDNYYKCEIVSHRKVDGVYVAVFLIKNYRDFKYYYSHCFAAYFRPIETRNDETIAFDNYYINSRKPSVTIDQYKEMEKAFYAGIMYVKVKGK